LPEKSYMPQPHVEVWMKSGYWKVQSSRAAARRCCRCVLWRVCDRCTSLKLRQALCRCACCASECARISISNNARFPQKANVRAGISVSAFLFSRNLRMKMCCLIPRLLTTGTLHAASSHQQQHVLAPVE
jgi:hypothetical protein